jgi:insertion element IS1 protein InsB
VVKEQIIAMAMYASGIRDTARVLHVSTNTVMAELKKAPDLHQVNHTVLQAVNPERITVEMCRSEELDRRRGLTLELDEMWSYVAKQSQPRWLWHAMDHHTGTV